VPPSPLLDAHCRALVSDLKKQASAAKCRRPASAHAPFFRLKQQQTQAHLTLNIGYTEGHDEQDSMIPTVAKKSIAFCESSVAGDVAPPATENFFAFPFIEDFIDQQTPAEHKHRAMSRCRRSLAPPVRHVLTRARSSVVTADRTLKPDSQAHHLVLADIVCVRLDVA
jgi:hypothetical protein